ncbi:hypothetical protein [Streptomyces sp. NPDC004270]
MIDGTPAALRAEVAHLYTHGPPELIRASLATVAEDARILRGLAREAAGPFRANTEGEAAAASVGTAQTVNIDGPSPALPLTCGRQHAPAVPLMRTLRAEPRLTKA